MSSLPGLTLEAYLMWNYDLIVDGNTSANSSLHMAETLGTSTKRIRIPQAKFDFLVALLEPHRGVIEEMLVDFNEAQQSWRMYAPSVSVLVDESVWTIATNYVQSLRELYDTPQASTLKPQAKFSADFVPAAEDLAAVSNGQDVEIDYTNYRGERTIRHILPLAWRFGHTEYHTEDQWLLRALDLDKQALRDYAVADIHRWGKKLRRLGEGVPNNFVQDVAVTINAVDLMEAAARISASIDHHTVGTTNWAACMLAHLLEVSAKKKAP